MASLAWWKSSRRSSLFALAMLLGSVSLSNSLAQEMDAVADSETRSLFARRGRMQTVSDEIEQLEAGEPETIELTTCQSCGNLQNGAGSCGCGTTTGPIPGVDFPRTSLFWCNPYGDVVSDPCDRDMCVDCERSMIPMWYASAELVPLFREQKEDVTLQRLGPGGPAILDTGDFQTDFDAGARFTVGVALTEWYRLEGSYLGMQEWDDRVAVRNSDANAQGGAGNLFSPFSNFGQPNGLVGADFNNFASAEMTSKFGSVELNLRRRMLHPRNPWPNYRSTCIANSFLVGVRHLDVDETFGYVSNSTSPAGGAVQRANIGTTNELLGIQVGLLSQFLTRRHGWIDFELKGGIYHNEMTLASNYLNTNGAGAALAQFDGTDARDRTAFLGELSLNYNYQLWRHCTFRAGYNAFWLTGVAVASENLGSDLVFLAAGPAQLQHHGEIVYHGPSVGLVYAY